MTYIKYECKFISHFSGTQNLNTKIDAGYEGTNNYEPIAAGIATFML